MMRPVILESPYAGDRAAHLEYARDCMRDCLKRGEAPFASHLIYTQVLDDDVRKERAQGVAAGFAWVAASEATVVYIDAGISPGMARGIAEAEALGHPVEYRRLYPPGIEA